MAGEGEPAEINRMVLVLDTNHYNELTADCPPAGPPLLRGFAFAFDSIFEGS